MAQRTLFDNLMVFGRNIMSRKLFPVLRKHVSGKVLDVGGGDFYLTVRRKNITFSSWTTLEHSKEMMFDVSDMQSPDIFKTVLGDGTNMKEQFPDESFDTVLNIHVLEHTMDPVAMVQECARVLRPGGKAVFLIPQTASIHLTPNNFCNFTRFWIERVMPAANLEIQMIEPLGGLFSTIAFKLFHFFAQAARVKDRTHPDVRRNMFFYIMSPVYAIYALVNIPILLLFSLGDLQEEANNHLVVVKKR